MADATFDGINLIITLPASEALIDVETDLYGAWKRFMLADPLNRRFPIAFRTIGGDTLTPGIDAGAYFFLQNGLGWRIRPAEEDATVLVVGNIAPEDSTLPMTIPTIGAFTVLLQGLQPITQSVETILLAQQDATYNGEVWIDLAGGVAGTLFPIGTSSNPANNVVDAYTIAARLNVRHFVVANSTIILDRASANWIFEGRGAQPSVDINAQDVSGSEFLRCSPLGDLANTSGEVRFTEARLVNVDNFSGIAEACGLSATISLKAGSSTFVRCFSQVVGQATPIINCQSQVVEVGFRAYDGGLEVTNFDQPANNLSIDANSARIVLGPTVTDGTCVIRGTGELDDTSGDNLTLVTGGFVDAQEIEIIHQLTAGNVDVSLDDLTITVFEQGSTTVALATFSVTADGRIRRRTG